MTADYPRDQDDAANETCAAIVSLMALDWTADEILHDKLVLDLLRAWAGFAFPDRR